MFYFTENRCSVCKAIIPKGKKMCDICEELYPCHKCTIKAKSVCMCSRWRLWFRHQWAALQKAAREERQSTPKAPKQ